MKSVVPNWADYYAIFLVKKEGDENTSTLIASTMTAEMGIDYAKYLSRKYEKQRDVVGLYVRKLFGDIIYAYNKEPINDNSTSKQSKQSQKKRAKRTSTRKSRSIC